MKEPSAQEKVVAKLGPVQAAMQKAQKVLECMNVNARMERLLELTG